MTDSWYYTRDGQQIGPVTRPQLVAALLQSPFWHQEYVWKTGDPAWRQAGAVDELSSELAQSHLEQLSQLERRGPPPPKASMKATLLAYAGLALLGIVSAIVYFFLF